jgi:hypothetical protein
MIERRRLLLMRHGAVEYFDAEGRPHPPDAVPLTPTGVEQARAMGADAGSGRRDHRSCSHQRTDAHPPDCGTRVAGRRGVTADRALV